MKTKEEPTPPVAELAVKGKYAESNRLVAYLNNKISERDSFVLKMLWEQDNEFKKSSMFDYVIKFDVNFPYNGLTELKPYENKSGITKLAHFNGDRYIGSVIKLGAKPVVCPKYETPNREHWTINENGKFVKRR
tara:strand:- start:66 stop:467 length:402 start_codon:yes stop_codon:yes gene_type:complete